MITSLSLTQLAEVTEGELVGGDVSFVSISTDSRSIKKSELFIALKGPNFNGSLYVANVEEKGAVAALVEDVQSVDIPQVKVQNTLKALGDVAKYNREQFKGKVVAVTGSSGKTSVKEMLAAILNEEGPTLSTAGNLNNNIGAPLTLLRIEDSHKYAVIELGASAVGEITYTAALTQPDIAVITNAANAHLEGFGSYDNIVTAKGEIVEALGDNGIAVLNADDPAFEKWLALASPGKSLSFSLYNDKNADVWAESIKLSSTLSEFELCWPGGRTLVSLPLPGKHNIANALAASCAANALGVKWESVKSALSHLNSVKGRLEITVSEAGYTVINDTYNANPSSTRAALDVLANAKGFRTVILGDMGELGADAKVLHEQAGRYAKEGRADALYACGEFADSVVAGYGKGAHSFASKAELIESLMKELQRGATYLVKGSRNSAMEEVVDQMLKQKVVA
jgi:UDP-N-acetylmuramoyl-tripeptide--D-alanyl-D-alanine ligase